MKGHVVLVNRELGWFAIQQDNKDVTVVDGLGDPLPRLDDVVEGNFHSTTRDMLSNRTSGDALIVRMMGTGPGLPFAAAIMQRGRIGLTGVPVRLRGLEPRPSSRTRGVTSIS